MGTDEAEAIVQLLGPAPHQSLNILEQAKFVVELLSVHKLSLAEVAQTLSRSKAWVSMRQDLLREMSGELQAILLRGAFPVYSYMYTLRPFMRLNETRGREIEQFVTALANQKLSVREIELLAQGYFRGPEAVIVPEMVAFGQTYGFEFICHELRHPNRKAGEERSFWTLETNFLPGRQFASLETVKVLYYADRLKICLRGSILAEYPLPADGVKNKKISPPDQPAPRHGPNNRKQDSQPEEQRLRNLGSESAAYLEFAVKVPGVQRHRFTCQLFALSRQLTENVFLETVRRAESTKAKHRWRGATWIKNSNRCSSICDWKAC